jgi:oxalate decarboxylase/phosphoglucose isomerase-like protein (cupin superfamily)
MPDATAMAGVNMRLEPGAYRELHWHVAAEWSLVLNGSCRIQVCGSVFSMMLLTVRPSTRMGRLSLTT